MSDEQRWTAEQTSHPDARNNSWAIVYNPTPGGVDNGDGTTSYSLRFPALLISDCVGDPETAARGVAAELNAFPDLLEALQQFVNGVETGMIDSPADNILTNVTRQARAAIAKAKGEAS